MGTTDYTATDDDPTTEGLSTIPPSTATTEQITTAGDITTVAVPTTESPSGLPAGAIVGIVLGVLIAIALVVIIIIYFIRKRKADNRNKSDDINLHISSPTAIEPDKTNGNTPDNIYVEDNESINTAALEANASPQLPIKTTKRTPADGNSTTKSATAEANSPPQRPNKITVANNEPDKTKTSAIVNNHTYGNVSPEPNDTYYLDMTVGKANDDERSLSNVSIPELKTTMPPDDTETFYVYMPPSDESSLADEPVTIPKPKKSDVSTQAAQVTSVSDGKESKMESGKLDSDSAQNDQVYENYDYTPQLSPGPSSLHGDENIKIENQKATKANPKQPESKKGKIDQKKNTGPIQEEIYENTTTRSDSERSSLCEERPGIHKKGKVDTIDKTAKSDKKQKVSKNSNKPNASAVEDEQIYMNAPDSPSDGSPILSPEHDDGTYQQLQKSGEENRAFSNENNDDEQIGDRKMPQKKTIMPVSGNIVASDKVMDDQYYGNVVFMPKEVIKEAANVANNNNKHHQDTDNLLVDARSQVAKLSNKKLQ